MNGHIIGRFHLSTMNFRMIVDCHCISSKRTTRYLTFVGNGCYLGCNLCSGICCQFSKNRYIGTFQIFRFDIASRFISIFFRLTSHFHTNRVAFTDTSCVVDRNISPFDVEFLIFFLVFFRFEATLVLQVNGHVPFCSIDGIDYQITIFF